MNQFGKLVVLDTFEKQRPRKDRIGQCVKVVWHTVQCSCGSKPFDITEYSLFFGSQMCHSCSHSGKNNSKGSHGESDCKARGHRRCSTPEYRAWKSIKMRCYNPKFKQYKDYGGRGIEVCERWLNSYEAFLADMGRKPTLKHSINRKDNNCDYCPENCEWADDATQRLNKRTSAMIEIDGESRNLSEWLKILKVPEGTYYWRRKHGYEIHEALGLRRPARS